MSRARVAATRQPWTERKQVRSALNNEHVRIGERTLPDGSVLRGLYAMRAFAPGDYVASFHGTVIPRAEVFALGKSDPARFEQINEYAIETPAGDHLCPDVDSLGAHLIDHSCGPNAEWPSWERGVLLVRAIRPIAVDQEVTADYGWTGLKTAMDGRRHPCACDAPMCAGFIELYVEWIPDEDDARAGSLRLPPEEVSKRLLVDIVNDTNTNGRLLVRYPKTVMTMMGNGAQISRGIDPAAFLAKMQRGAREAVHAALALRASGGRLSMRRLQQIARVYEVPL